MKNITVTNLQHTEIVTALENHILHLENKINSGAFDKVFTVSEQRNFLVNAKSALIEVERKCRTI